MLLRGGDQSAPEFLHLREIEFRGNAELHGERLGTRHDGIQLARDLQDGLAAQVFEREINQVEINSFQQQTAGRGNAFLRLRFEPQRLAEGSITRPFEELPDRLDTA